jgi:hypothetical protein
MNESIPLSQKLYLLGIHPEKGGIISSSQTAMNYILVGCLFLELYQNENITFENKRIIVRNHRSEIPLHSFMLKKLSASDRPLKISRCISKFNSSFKFIRKEVQKELVQKRLIRMQQKQFIVFKWKVPVITNKQVLYRILQEVQDSVFEKKPDENEIILLSFIKPAGLMKRIFPERNKRKQASKNLKEIMVNNPVSIAVADAISAAQAVAASVAATSAATT